MVLDLKDGDLAEFVGFNCLPNGEIRLINVNSDGELYFFCDHGSHIIDNETKEDLRREWRSITKVEGVIVNDVRNISRA